MTGTEFLALIRPRIGDSAKATYDDNELLGYLNDAIIQLSMERIIGKDPQMIIEESVTPGTTTIPARFQSFAGQIPVYFSDGKIMALDGTVTPLTVRYFATKERLAAPNGTIPFGDESIPALTNAVVVIASARVGADAQTEGSLAIRQMEGITIGSSPVGRYARSNQKQIKE